MHPVPSPTTLACRPLDTVSALPTSHTLRFSCGGTISGLNYGSLTLRPADLFALLVGADSALALPTRTFTSGLSAVWSPAPPPDIATETTGQVSLAGFSSARTTTSFAAGPIDTHERNKLQLRLHRFFPRHNSLLPHSCLLVAPHRAEAGFASAKPL